ncbi:MAG: YlbF family regulator [Halobacterium sp.]
MSVDSDVESASAVESTEVDDLARELGEAITELPEYEAFEASKEAVETNEEVQDRISEFEELRQEFMLARQTGDATQEDVERVQEAQQHLHDHPVMAEYLEAQDRLQETFEHLNDVISEPMAVDFVGESGACCQD